MKKKGRTVCERVQGRRDEVQIKVKGELGEGGAKQGEG